MFVWDARYQEQWESDREFGLFQNKADAKKACQDEQDKDNPRPLKWNNTRRVYAEALASFGNYAVIRREVN